MSQKIKSLSVVFNRNLFSHSLLVMCLVLSLNAYSQDAISLQIDSIFMDWDKTDEPGGAVGILKKGKLVYSKGFGLADLEHNIPIQPNTVFYCASLSKQFTAFCILLLAEQGKLSLTDEVQKYLPDFPVYERPVTISHLVHHTSGLRDFSTLFELQGRSYLEDLSSHETYELIKRQKALNFLPGDDYGYSNSGYFLLYKIIELVSGRSLREFANENIFLPLGMTNTMFLDDNKILVKNRAFSYDKNGDGSFANVIRRYDLVGSGGVYSTIEDFAKWDANFYSNKLGKNNQALLKLMMQEDTLSNGKRSGYAFGLENKLYRGIKRVSHSGSNAGFRTFFLRFPENELSIILFSNRRDGDLNKIFRVADVLLKKQLLPQSVVEVKPKAVADKTTFIAADHELKRLAGDYYSEELKCDYSFSVDNDQLRLSVNGSESLPLKIQSATSIHSDTMGDFKFLIKKGKAIRFTLDIARVNGIIFNRVK